jgi:pilus assembly protein TadC
MTKIYAFGFNDYLLSILKHILFAVISGYLFFHSFYAVIILLLFYPFTLRNEKKNKRKKDEIKLNSEFIDALNSLSSAFEAGYAAENAFREPRASFIQSKKIFS